MAGGPGLTPAQTVGPFLHLALADPVAAFAVPDGSRDAIAIEGRVFDGAGDAVADAVVETWQIDGRFARCATDDDGKYRIVTTKPPAVATAGGAVQAPHLVVSVFARGLLDRVVTRIYFADEASANAADPVIGDGKVDPERRDALIADVAGPAQYRFDIVLQEGPGGGESVFFAV